MITLSRSTIFLFLISAALVSVLSFLVVDMYSMRVDGPIYIAQVEQFEQGTLSLETFDVALRAYKPFIGVVGSLVVPFITPAQAIQYLNIFFLFLLPFAAYCFLRELGFETRGATWGAVWILTGYPLLKYGLAISTDLGSWLFALLTAYLVLKGLRQNSIRVLILASLIGFIGGTIKETGVLGLVFGGLYMLFSLHTRPYKDTFTYLCALAIPAFVLEVILLGALIYAGFPSFIDWFAANRDGYYESEYTLFKFIAVFGSTFHILFLYALIGLITFFKDTTIRRLIPSYLALAIASGVVLTWSIFISRIFYIQFLIMVPLALIGIEAGIRHIRLYEPFKSYAIVLLYLIPILSSITLFVLSGYGSLFRLLPG